MKYDQVTGLGYGQMKPLRRSGWDLDGVLCNPTDRPCRTGWDLDGVLCNQYAPMMAWAKEKGIEGVGDCPPTYALDWVPADLYEECVQLLYGADGWILHAEPFPGALNAFKRSQSVGKAIIVTARREHLQEATALWLGAYGFKPDALIFSPDKAGVAEALELTTFIDDSPNNLLELTCIMPPIQVYRPECLYTHNAPGTPYSSLDELFTKLKVLA